MTEKLIELLKIQITDLEAEAKRIKREIAEKKIALAEQLCPYKIGQIMVLGAKRARVTRIELWFGYTPLPWATDIKKDGTTGGREHRLYPSDNWQPEKAPK